MSEAQTTDRSKSPEKFFNTESLVWEHLSLINREDLRSLQSYVLLILGQFYPSHLLGTKLGRKYCLMSVIVHTTFPAHIIFS